MYYKGQRIQITKKHDSNLSFTEVLSILLIHKKVDTVLSHLEAGTFNPNSERNHKLFTGHKIVTFDTRRASWYTT